MRRSPDCDIDRSWLVQNFHDNCRLSLLSAPNLTWTRSGSSTSDFSHFYTVFLYFYFRFLSKYFIWAFEQECSRNGWEYLHRMIQRADKNLDIGHAFILLKISKNYISNIQSLSMNSTAEIISLIRHMLFTCDLYSHSLNIVIHQQLCQLLAVCYTGRKYYDYRTRFCKHRSFSLNDEFHEGGEGVSGFRSHFRIFEHWTLTSVTLRRRKTSRIFCLINIRDKGTTGWYSGAPERRPNCPEGQHAVVGDDINFVINDDCSPWKHRRLVSYSRFCSKFDAILKLALQ